MKIRAFHGFVECREGRRVARVPVQPAWTTIKWNPSHASESIPEEKRAEILESVVNAMRSCKYIVEVVEKTIGKHFRTLDEESCERDLIDSTDRM